MELNSVNTLGFSNVTQSNLNQAKSVNQVELDSNSKPLKVDRVELQNQSQSSSFANSLINNVKQISSALSIQSTVSKQLDITNEIEQSINLVVSNPSSGQTLNDIQPKIKNLMDSFNTLSSSISTKVNTISSDSNEEEKSRVYFDGILGAKPLSSEEIFAEVTSQRERLQSINKAANEEVLNNVQKSKDLFTNQKQELVTQQPQIKNVDYKVESDNFSSKTLQNVSGDVVDTQANAQVDKNIKLLAS